MAAHPQLSMDDATEIVKYVLSLNNKEQKASLPTKGSYTTKMDKNTKPGGVYLLRAAYTDKGANGVPAATSEQTMMLRSATVPAETAEDIDGIQKYKVPGMPFTVMIGQKNGSYLGFKQLDLTGVDQLVFVASASAQYGMQGGTVEVRLDSPTGEVIGESTPIVPTKEQGMPAPIMAVTKLKSVAGTHDIYAIYKNEKTVAGQMLFVLTVMQVNYNAKTASVSQR